MLVMAFNNLIGYMRGHQENSINSPSFFLKESFFSNIIKQKLITTKNLIKTIQSFGSKNTTC